MKRTILLIIVLVFALGLTSQINAQVNYHTGTIEFTDVSQNIVDNYPRGSSNIFIKLDDTDLDADAGSPQSIDVTIVSSTEDSTQGYFENVTLIETGNNTGIFTGSISLNEGGIPSANSQLEVNIGDSLIVTYFDDDDFYGQDKYIVTITLYGYTEISGVTYTSAETWLKLLSPYLITGDVNINSGGVLTIESGVEVRFMPNTDKTVGGSDNTRSEIRVNNNGVLNAEGTIADSIKFTSQSSDPGNDDWYGIYTNESAQFNIAYSVISNARYGLHTQQLDNDNGGSSIKNSNISNVSTYGVYCYNFFSAITELIIEQNKITNYGYVNTYGDGSGTGIYVEKVGNLTEILNNEIENTANNANATNSYFRGIGLYESDAKISGNTISGANYGIEITGSNLPINTPQITNNTIEETKRGIHIGSNNLAPVINYNNLADNTEFGIYNNGDQEIDAKSNWWGDAATGEIDLGNNPKNLAYIYDIHDDGSKGFVNYGAWLDGPNGNSTGSGNTGIVQFTDMNWNSVDNYSGGTVNVYIKLEDPDLNTNVGDQETINVTVASSTDETGTTVLLTETGADTDIFTGSATIYESGGSGDLEVSRGDSLIVSYNDASDDFGNAQIISADVLYGYTEISGITYTTSETWTKVLSPYLITGDVNINSGGVLTIESGVEVRFMPNTDKTVGGSDNTRSEIRVNNNGVLNAEGTIADSIKFTSQSSDPGNDDWYGIYTNESAQFNIAYSVISNARYGLHTQQLDNDNGGSSIKNSNISNVSTYGVYCYNFFSAITELIIEQNKITNYGYVNTYGDGSGTGIYVEKVGNLTEILNNEIENTANNANATNSYFRGIGLYESDAKISGNTISGANYGIEITGSNLPINTPQITNNTIEETKRGIHIGSNNLAPVINYNNLADNTEFGIYNNGDQEIDAKSNWWGDAATGEIDLGNNPKNLAYIYDIHDDGSKGFVNYGAWLDGPNGNSTGSGNTGIVQFTDMNWNSVDNYSGGTVNVYIKLEDPDLNTNVGDQETINVTVASSTDETGTTVLLTETGADTDIFTGSATIYESGGSGDLEVSRGDSLIVSYNDASDDFGNAQIISADVLYGYTEISGITYTTSETWTKVLSPYLITGDVNINSGGVLTIESGVEVRFMPNTDKTVGGSDNTRSEIRVNNNGVLNAEGTIADSIKFTSQSSDPGNDDWYGIYTNESAQFNIAYSVISNARYGLHTQQLDNDNGGSSIKNSNISNVSTYGVYCYNFFSAITELIIEQNKITNYGYVNTYGDGSGTGIYVEKVGNLTEILNNEIENTANNANATNSYFRGIGLYESDAKISGNTISGANYGIEITGSNLPINTPQITNNTIEETKRGIHIGSNNLAPVINYNNLADNTEFGIYNNGDQEIDAKSNWWGEIATDEMDAGGNPKNITYIYDQYDDNSKGEVIYAWWPTASTVIETEDVAAGQNELTFEETNTSLSINSSTTGSITIAKVFGNPEPSALPAEVNTTTNFYFNAESNGVTFTDGAIGVPLSSLGTTVNPATLKWLKRENATEDWVQIGGTVDGDNFVSTVPFNSFSEFTIGSNSAIVQVVVNIEGAYSGSGMIHDLNDSKKLPFVQPFNDVPFNYEGDERVSLEFYNTNADIADWILLELRTGETPETATTVVGQKACFVKSDGTVIDEDGTTVLEFFGTPPGSYYLVVKHRNHLPVMSPVEVNMN